MEQPMDLTGAIAALRSIQSHHETAKGVQIGFFMPEATSVLGGLALASNALAMLLAKGLVESEAVVLNGVVHTIYRVADAKPPSSRAVH